MIKAEKLKLCDGCHSDFYNGHNPYGINFATSNCPLDKIDCCSKILLLYSR